MEKQEQQPITADMAGLTGIRVGHLYYAGKIDKRATEAVRKELGRDFVVLKDAFELLISRRASETGMMQVQITPAWIAPFNNLIQSFKTRMDSRMDLSKVDDAGFHGMVRSMGGKGLILPGLGGPLVAPR